MSDSDLPVTICLSRRLCPTRWRTPGRSEDCGGRSGSAREVDVHRLGVLHDLHGLLIYHRNSGISHYPKNEAVIQFLQSVDLQGAGYRSPETDPRPVAQVAACHEPERVSRGTQSAAVSLTDIAKEVSQCRACNLAEGRLATRAGRGGGRVRLLVVGSWLIGDSDKPLPEETQFGLEEDRMLFRMLAAINVQPEQAFITNAIKCVVPGSIHPLAENARICLSYLHRQIALLEPESICTMGIMATRALLGLPQPLSQLRGKLHAFQADAGREIPVMATYHPSFLLQNPEMKKAVWLDLQSLGRQMKTLL